MKHTTLRRFLPLTIFGAVLVALILAASASAAIYSVTDIGTLGGEWSEATAINNRGEVTGQAQTDYKGSPSSQAFRYRHGAMTDVGPIEKLPGDPDEIAAWSSRGEAINDRGDIAGWVEGPGGYPYPEVFKADGSIDYVFCNCRDGSAQGINNADEVVGGGSHEFRLAVAWLINSEGERTEFGEEGCGGGPATAINNRGQVVGRATFGGGPCNGYGYREGATAFLLSGGTLYHIGEWSPYAINETGTIVGGGSDGHAVSYRHGKLTDLGTLAGDQESWAFGVNDFGEIVGASGEEVLTDFEGRLGGKVIPGHAFLDVGGLMFDLDALIPPNSGWELLQARGINDRGEIVGTGLHNGIKRGFILKPRWLWF